jgi:predicted RNA-binding protein with PUA-like domain
MRNGETDVARSHWLVKSEPFKYSWSDLVRDGSTYWDGVRNYQARNNLREMRVGDRALYYHSNEGKEVVGVARITKTAYQDPTTADDRWLVVDLEPLKPLTEPVTLAQIKADAALQEIPLVTHSRLSVMPLDKAAFDRILSLGETKLR